MVGTIVEIATDGQFLSVDRGFLVASQHGSESARIPLDDIEGLISEGLISAAHGLSFSCNALVALAERGCPVVVCGHKFRPDAIIWPLHGNYRSAARLSAQIAVRLPTRKRLWGAVVRAKIRSQAVALESSGISLAALRQLEKRVRAGDPGNVEAQAARVYWSALMGSSFRRDPDADGLNALLNYGYAVLRACLARHIAAAGLHPNVPLNHRNERNPLRLADDLMEPFRPLVDACVVALRNAGQQELNRATKTMLGSVPSRSLECASGSHPVAAIASHVCVSLAQVFEGERKELDLPTWSARAVRQFSAVTE
jgi:CRISPR-associated protein Cas1